MIQSSSNKKWVQLQWCHIQCVPKKIESRPYNDGPHANPQFRVLLTAPFAECWSPAGSPEGHDLRRLLCGIGWRRFHQARGSVQTSGPRFLGASTARRVTSTAKDVAFFLKWDDHRWPVDVIIIHDWNPYYAASCPPPNIGHSLEVFKRENHRSKWGLSSWLITEGWGYCYDMGYGV